MPNNTPSHALATILSINWIVWESGWKARSRGWITNRVTTKKSYPLFHFFFRVKDNKAGYTATEVACWWAGAIFEVTRPFGQEQGGQTNKIIKKSKVWPTDRPTDQPTDRPTDKAGCRVACTRLKMREKNDIPLTISIQQFKVMNIQKI